ncbi:MAG: CorA family divalent cation transporter [Patescibacteria group bacterium]
MIKEFKYKNITWLDVELPTPEEIATLAKDYKLHPVVANELLGTSQRSKVDLYEDFIYLILHFPNYHSGSKHTGTDDEQEVNEIDFVIGHDFLITTHYESLEPMQELEKILEANIMLDKNKKETQAGFLFYYIIRHLYQSLDIRLESINNSFKQAEKNVFTGKEKEMVVVLSGIHKQLLDFRWTLKSHREILGSLEIAGQEFFGKKFEYYLHSISGEYEKIWNLLENNRDLFYDLRNTNDSMLSIKTNQAIKVFTFLAFITFPLSLIATVFGMGAKYTPLIGSNYDFWIITGSMVFLACVIFIVFRLKRWI